MKLEDFEQRVRPANNKEAIEALIDAFLALPCGPNEQQQAARVRADWKRMQAQGNWEGWTTQDLVHLHVMIDVMGRMMAETNNSLALFLLARKLNE